MQPELVFRIHAFFRNLVRVGAARLPNQLEVDAYDHATFSRRMKTDGDRTGRRVYGRSPAGKPVT